MRTVDEVSKAVLVDNSGFITYLFERWEDEFLYERFEDYVEALRARVPEVTELTEDFTITAECSDGTAVFKVKDEGDSLRIDMTARRL